MGTDQVNAEGGTSDDDTGGTKCVEEGRGVADGIAPVAKTRDVEVEGCSATDVRDTGGGRAPKPPKATREEECITNSAGEEAGRCMEQI